VSAEASELESRHVVALAVLSQVSVEGKGGMASMDYDRVLISRVRRRWETGILEIHMVHCSD